MATPSFALVQILRETADRLAGGAEYQWSHFGKCNCGHLAQTATRISARDIHRTAHRKLSEWSEIPDDFCPQTGVLIDRVIDTLFELGLTNTDLRHLEDLTDPEVLARLPGGWRYLQRNQRDDVIVYLRTWAGLLEEKVARDGWRVTGANPSAEGAAEPSPGFTLGRHRVSDQGLKGRQKVLLSSLPPLQG
jgi:hypothetical protein